MFIIHHFGPNLSISPTFELFHLKAQLCLSAASEKTFTTFVLVVSLAVDFQSFLIIFLIYLMSYVPDQVNENMLTSTMFCKGLKHCRSVKH